MNDFQESELVAMKDRLWSQAQVAKVADLFDVTIQLEECFKDWCKCDYHYKGAEIAFQAQRTIGAKGWFGVNTLPTDELWDRLETLRARFSAAECLSRAGTPYGFAGQCLPAGYAIV